MQETFYRPDFELLCVSRTLPAATYNRAHTLLARSQTGCVFVPIRPMQYMAVLDGDEFIFVDRTKPRLIELCWRSFHPGDRAALTDPVPFDLVYYDKNAEITMKRLPMEFHKALALIAERQITGAPSARILNFERKR